MAHTTTALCGYFFDTDFQFINKSSSSSPNLPPPGAREVWWPHYLGESAETAETAAIIFELAISAASGQGLPPRQTSPPAAERVLPRCGYSMEGGRRGGRREGEGGGGEGEQEVGRFSKCYTFEKVRVGVAFAIFWVARVHEHKIPLRGYADKTSFLFFSLSLLLHELIAELSWQ